MAPSASHIIELRPTKEQEEYLLKSIGVMRYVYNRLVEKIKAGERYDRRGFQKFCTTLRQGTPWMQEVSSRATYEAADDFYFAMRRFFLKSANLPSFKKKGKPISFKLSHSTHFRVEGRRVKVQGLRTWIPMREQVRFNGTVKAVAIKSRAGKWYATFRVETPEVRPEQSAAREPIVGVDLGIKSLAVLSTGEVIENPKPLQKKLKLLKRRQRQMSQKLIIGEKVQSNRFLVSKQRVSRLYKKISDQRRNAQHQLTSGLVRRFNTIVIEDLAISNLGKNRRLARAIKDAGWGQIRQQLVYKSVRAGVNLIIADQYFPSTKTCSCCGHKVDSMPLNKRIFDCVNCGNSQDRDLNAAINLANYTLTPPIRGSHKTDALDLCKTSSEAGLLKGVNTQNLHTEGLPA